MAWSDFIKNFRDALSQAKEKAREEASGDRIDKPELNENDFWAKHRAAFNGQRYVNEGDGPEPSARIAEETPLSYDDVQRIMPYKQFFDMNMDLYSKEADPDKRIQLLDFMGTKTPLGRLPGMARYLQIMRNTEDAVKREGTSNYQYGATAKHFQDVLNGEINKFGPHRA